MLCNKYFLRTHMAKRHGVSVDTRGIQLAPVRDLAPPASMINGGSTPAVHQLSSAVDADPAGAAAVAVDRKDVMDCCADGGDKTGAVNLIVAGRTSSDVQTVTARTWQVPADDAPPSGGVDACSQQTDHTTRCSETTYSLRNCTHTRDCRLYVAIIAL